MDKHNMWSYARERTDQPGEVTQEVKRRTPRRALDRPAKLPFRRVHRVELEFVPEARLELHVDDELHSAERGRERPDNEDARTICHQPIVNGNRGSIVTMRRSAIDRRAASSACADTRKLSV
jgi:hypothetical protein